MQVLVKDLVKSCEYTLSTFLKVLTLNGISNHKVLTHDDLVLLKRGVKIVGKHSYSLHIEINRILSDSSLKVDKND